MSRHITRQDLKAALDRGDPITLVEALPERYWREEHLPGALNVPHDEVDARAPRLLPDKTATVVVYCASADCRNSAIAAERLRTLGYADVREYTEGKKDWIEAGLPIEAVAPALPETV